MCKYQRSHHKCPHEECLSDHHHWLEIKLLGGKLRTDDAAELEAFNKKLYGC